MRLASITTRSRTFIGLLPQLAAILVAAAAPACTGDAGADGNNGPAGQDGSDGAPGGDGAEGPKGEPGESANVDPSLSPLEKVFVGIGGEDLLAGLTTLKVSSSGAHWMPGEWFRPTDPLQRVATFDLDLSFDLEADNLRLHYVRELTFLGITAHTDFSEIIAGDVGVVDGVDALFGGPPNVEMSSSRWAATRRHQRLLHPLLILRDLSVNPALVLDDKGLALLDGSVHHLLVLEDPVSPVTLWVNAATGWINKISLVENDPLHRDVEVAAFFYGWGTMAAGGLRFPSEAYIAHDGNIVHQETRSAITVNEPIPAESFVFPADLDPTYDAEGAHRGEANCEGIQVVLEGGFTFYDAQQKLVNATELSPGVYYLTGGSHNSLVVDQADGLVLIEAPLEEGRSEAILSWKEETFPGRPIKHVVTTHHHSDHAGGVRTIVAAGARSVISAASLDYFKEILSAPSQVYPDALELNPTAYGFETVPVAGSLTLSDAERPVTLYHVSTVHAFDMVMAYVPSAQLIFQSDLINPGTPLFILPAFHQAGVDLVAAINAEGIASPELKIVGGHGTGPNTLVEVETALGQ